jgi:dTDP-L-rhamnose 4-epimerase
MAEHVLITGGASFIGSYLADRPLMHDYKVRVLDNLDPQVNRPNPYTGVMTIFASSILNGNALTISINTSAELTSRG